MSAKLGMLVCVMLCAWAVHTAPNDLLFYPAWIGLMFFALKWCREGDQSPMQVQEMDEARG